MSLVAFTAPLASLTVTGASLHAGPAAQTWALSSMSPGLASALLVAGALGDDLGRPVPGARASAPSRLDGSRAERPHPVDLPGMVLLAGALALLVIGLGEGWRSSTPAAAPVCSCPDRSSPASGAACSTRRSVVEQSRACLPDRSGTGSGADNTTRYLGSAVGVTVVVAVVGSGSGPTAAAALVDGWDRASLVAAGLAVLGALAVWVRSRVRTAP